MPILDCSISIIDFLPLSPPAEAARSHGRGPTAGQHGRAHFRRDYSFGIQREDMARRSRNRSSAELYSAVSRIFNPPNVARPECCGTRDALPNAIRRYSRLQICATPERTAGKKFAQKNKIFMDSNTKKPRHKVKAAKTPTASQAVHTHQTVIPKKAVVVFKAPVVPSPNLVAFGGDSPGARTALSASSTQRPSNTRTRLSALLWLRLRRAMPLRQDSPAWIRLGNLVPTGSAPESRAPISKP